MVRASARDDGDDARWGGAAMRRVWDVVEIALVKDRRRRRNEDGARGDIGLCHEFGFHADGIKVA